MVDVRIHDLVLTSPMVSTHQLEIDIGSGTSSGRVTGTTVRTFILKYDDLTADTPVAADILSFYDVSGSDTNRTTITSFNGVIDHGLVAGLADDDHSLYSLATGTRWTSVQTASRAVETNGSGHIIVSATTTADLDEIEGIANFDQGIRVFRNNVTVSSTVTLGTSHQNAFLYCDNASTATLTIPPNSTTAFVVGTEIEVWRSNASVAVVEGSGVTLSGHDGTTAVTTTATLATANTGCCIKKVATDTWVVFGVFTAS